MLKTIYFDIGNVLCFFSTKKMMDQVANCSGLSPDQIEQVLEVRQELYHLGKIDTEALYRYAKGQAIRDFTLSEFTEAISDIFTPNRELWPTVEALKKMGTRLILISNTCESHFNRVISHYPVLRSFDEKLLSFELGIAKPDPRIFRKALDLAQCNPSECFYIDDIPAFIASAKKVGLDGEVFTDVPSLHHQLALRGCDLFSGGR